MSSFLPSLRLTRHLARIIGSQCQTGARNATRPTGITRACPALLQTRMRGFAQQPQVVEEPEMFCHQCEQTKSRKGCTTVGVCGKSPQVAALQDLLRYLLKGISVYANRVIQKGLNTPSEIDDFMYSALFSTLTNVNFDASRFPQYIENAVKYREQLKETYLEACKNDNTAPDTFPIGPASWIPPSSGFSSVEDLETEGHNVGVLLYTDLYGPDLGGVRQMIVLGLKGMATYARHTAQLGVRDPSIPKFVYETFDFLETGDENKRKDLAHNLGVALEVGKTNLRVMELLDKAHRTKFGVPSPATISTKPKMGKSILVSGHDIADLAEILEVTTGKGVNIYTHGELLPAHAYPVLRQYKHFVGHFGGAWQLQKFDFAAFPGPIIVTTNCVIEPLRSYKERLFTMNDCGIAGVSHVDIDNPSDINKVVDLACEMEGFTHEVEGRDITVGFGREAILDNADKILGAVANGELKHIFVIGGCDGAENKRNYFTTLADALPKETLLLTMGCAKYRFNYQDFGNLGSTGIPRLLDLGQCNDSYGAIVIAQALASSLNTDINSLPMSITLSWFEQKSVAVLLTLLYLGMKNIRLGPVLPAFLTPTVLGILEEKFNIMPVDIRHPKDDLKLMLGSN